MTFFLASHVGVEHRYRETDTLGDVSLCLYCVFAAAITFVVAQSVQGDTTVHSSTKESIEYRLHVQCHDVGQSMFTRLRLVP